MCHIKTNIGIENVGDLCGLVCGIILRQCAPFGKDSILALADEYIKGSKYHVTSKVLESMIEDRLNLYERNDDLSFRNGMYYPRALERYL